ASAGQLDPLPGHISAGSHSPAEARQTTKLGSNMSFAPLLRAPVQVSSTSQGPAEARQIVPALPAGCWQASLVPLQVSVVQTLPSSVQAVPDVFFASTGQVALVPVQKSSASHSPTAPRPSTVEDSNASFR